MFLKVIKRSCQNLFPFPYKNKIIGNLHEPQELKMQKQSMCNTSLSLLGQLSIQVKNRYW